MLFGIAQERLSFTADASVAYAGIDAALIAVGTPMGPTGAADLSHLDAAAATLAEIAPACTILIRSTVPVGTGDRMQRGTLRKHRVISNPEFLREGHAVVDSLRPDRVVGGGAVQDEPIMRAIYAAILEQSFRPFGTIAAADSTVPLLWMDRRSAELAKYASNAFLATKLSFVNEMANVAQLVGADIRAVTGVIGTDPRIGPAFLRPGIGWGGSCFPKDTRALAAFAAEGGYDFKVLKAVIEQNNDQLEQFFELIKREVGTGSRVRVGLLGLAFKAGTADCRESPAVALAWKMSEMGWTIRAFDPAVRHLAPGTAPDIELVASIEDAAVDADVIVVATEWPEFASADYPSLARRMRGDLVLDGRCAVDPIVVQKSGLRYKGICAPARSGD